jgi:hypothetical protein
MVKVKYLGVAGLAIAAALALAPTNVSADSVDDPAIDNCVIENGVAVITVDGQAAGRPCEINEAVSGAIYNGGIDDIVAFLDAYKQNAAFGGDNFSSATLALNLTDAAGISDANLVTIASYLPTGIDSVTVSTTNIVLTSLPISLPSGFSFDYSDSVVHIPADTTVADAVAFFELIDDITVTVAAGDVYNITAEGSDDVTTLHLNDGEDMQDVIDLINNGSLNDILVATPDYHVNLFGDTNTIYFESGTTSEEVAAALAGVAGFDADVRIIGDNEYNATLTASGEFVNFTELDAAKATTVGRNEEDYTEASWADLEGALAMSEDTQGEVDSKTAAINDAVAGLVNIVGLNSVKAEAATKNEGDYTTESWAVLKFALDLPETTQSEVDVKVAAINSAIGALEEKAAPTGPVGPYIVLGEDTEDGRSVIIVPGGANDSIIANIAKKNPVFAEFLKKLDSGAIFLELDDRKGCDDAGCAVTIMLSGLEASTTYYLYHYDDSGNVTFVGEFKTDAQGNVAVSIEKFSGNVLTKGKIVLAGAQAPSTGAAFTPAGDASASYGLAAGISALAGAGEVTRRKIARRRK